MPAVSGSDLPVEEQLKAIVANQPTPPAQQALNHPDATRVASPVPRSSIPEGGSSIRPAQAGDARPFGTGGLAKVIEAVDPTGGLGSTALGAIPNNPSLMLALASMLVPGVPFNDAKSLSKTKDFIRHIDKLDNIQASIASRLFKKGSIGEELEANTRQMTTGMSQRAIKRAGIIQPEREIGKALTIFKEPLKVDSLKTVSNEDLESALIVIDEFVNNVEKSGRMVPRTVAEQAATADFGQKMKRLSDNPFMRDEEVSFLDTPEFLDIDRWITSIQAEVIERIINGDTDAASRFITEDTLVPIVWDVMVKNKGTLEPLIGILQEMKSKVAVLELIRENRSLMVLP